MSTRKVPPPPSPRERARDPQAVFLDPPDPTTVRTHAPSNENTPAPLKESAGVRVLRWLCEAVRMFL